MAVRITEQTIRRTIEQGSIKFDVVSHTQGNEKTIQIIGLGCIIPETRHELKGQPDLEIIKLQVSDAMTTLNQLNDVLSDLDFK